MGSTGEPQQPVKKQTPAHNKPLKAIPLVELMMACRLLLIARNRQKAAKPPARIGEDEALNVYLFMASSLKSAVDLSGRRRIASGTRRNS